MGKSIIHKKKNEMKKVNKSMSLKIYSKKERSGNLKSLKNLIL